MEEVCSNLGESGKQTRWEFEQRGCEAGRHWGLAWKQVRCLVKRRERYQSVVARVARTEVRVRAA